MGLSNTNKRISNVNAQIANLKNAIKVFSSVPSDAEGDQIIFDFESMLKQREAEMKALREQKKEEEDAVKNEIECMDLPLDFFNEYEGDSRADFRVDSIEDGLIASLNNLGKVDIEYISKVSASDMKGVVRTLRGSIFQNPDKWGECWYKGWETSDEYLSGNLIKKYKAAEEADKKYSGVFKANVSALKELLPEFVDEKDIYITLGSPWVPTEVIDEFISYISGVKTYRNMVEVYKTRHDPLTGLWEIPCKTRFRHSKASVRNSETYGTPRYEMLYLLEATLNMRTPTVTDEVPSKEKTGKYTREVNQKETLLAIEKQKLLVETFQSWVWSDPNRAKSLQEKYYETYAGIRKRRFNGSYLTFPGMNKEVSLYPYQKNAVARILFTPNTLLAHDVGSGKTYVMIAAGMEMRRLGMSKKNLYVVPNNLIGQWKKIFLEMYPRANLLVIEPKDFTRDKRDSVLRTIAKKDFDGIIMAYSCFDMLPLSERYYKNFYKEQADKLKEARRIFYSDGPVNRRMKSIQNTLTKIHEKMKLCEYKLCFDDLGINTMFVDEAHNYKNVPVDTRITNNHSISTAGSEKCRLMMDRVRCIQEANGGRGVVFATGTPITNSVTDIFVMQKYLQNGELTLLGLQNFDNWIGMFAEKVSAYEIDIDTNSYHLVTRFSSFHNLPELTSILASIADFHQVDLGNGLPVLNGYTDKELEGSPYFRRYLKDISERAELVRKHRVKREEDNLLKITTDGRKAALDMRLIDPRYPEDSFCKVRACAENVLDIYEQTKDEKLTQLVFCDSSTPKTGFNMYDELKNILISHGVNPREIAFIHSYDTDAKREKLFKAVREGDIRILIGSTFKLGLGVNVQDKLYAVHHLDLPWRPADMVQREGRILRQGNTNPEVKIYRYITKGSFDAYSWQLLETKQRFISQLLSGSITEREGSDVDETVLDYAEIKALAVGNPKIKERCEVSNALDRERIIQREYVSSRSRLAAEKVGIPDKIKREKDLIALCELDKHLYEDKKREYSDKEAKDLRERISKAVSAGFENPEEKYIVSYQGFDVYVPSYMQRSKPMVLIRGNGKYYIEIGSESGITKRLNNFLENLDKKTLEYNDAIKSLKVRERAIKEELLKNESHEDQIKMLQEKLSEIDKELGIKK